MNLYHEVPRGQQLLNNRKKKHKTQKELRQEQLEQHEKMKRKQQEKMKRQQKQEQLKQKQLKQLEQKEREIKQKDQQQLDSLIDKGINDLNIFKQDLIDTIYQTYNAIISDEYLLTNKNIYKIPLFKMSSRTWRGKNSANTKILGLKHIDNDYKKKHEINIDQLEKVFDDNDKIDKIINQIDVILERFGYKPS